MPKRAAGTAGTTAAAAERDDPSLPETPAKSDENELRAAVGLAPLVSSDKLARASRDGDTVVGIAADADDDDAEREPRSRRSPRSVVFAVLAIVALLGAAVVVLIGYLNSGRYILACESERAVPEQGRGFPPWGARALAGDAWRPLPIAAATRCQPLETDDALVLQRAFLAMVLDQATAQLTAHEITKVDSAEALLKQALLLTRPPEHESDAAAKQRNEQHQEVERLLGDVAYWRAAAKVRDATAALGDAARQFDAAVSQHARHVSDAGAWAAYVRRLVQDINAGPAGTGPVGASAANALAGGAGSSSPGTAGVGSTGAVSAGSTGANSAGANSAGANSAGLGTAGSRPGGPSAAGSGAAGVGTAGASSAGVAGPGPNGPGAAHAASASTGAGSAAAPGSSAAPGATASTGAMPGTTPGAASASGAPQSSPSTPASGPSERGPAPPGVAAPAQPAAPPDAGVSTGGVLL